MATSGTAVCREGTAEDPEERRRAQGRPWAPKREERRWQPGTRGARAASRWDSCDDILSLPVDHASFVTVSRLDRTVRRTSARDRRPAPRPRRISGNRTHASWRSRSCLVSRWSCSTRSTRPPPRPQRLRLHLVHGAARHPVRDHGRRVPGRRSRSDPARQHHVPRGRGAARVVRRNDRRVDAPGPRGPEYQPRTAPYRAHCRLLHFHRVEHRRLPDPARRSAALSRVPAGRAVCMDHPARRPMARHQRPAVADLLPVGFADARARAGRGPRTRPRGDPAAAAARRPEFGAARRDRLAPRR